jgi:thiamine pyrophosphate-dependent acetolactate synthase large subunit-like protein
MRWSGEPSSTIHGNDRASVHQFCQCALNRFFGFTVESRRRFVKYRTQVANTLLLDNALATIGAGLPAGIMVALLHPRRRVLAVCGDGGLMMNAQELETAVRLRLDLVVLVLHDDAYGMIRWKQATDGFADFA